MNDKDGLPVVRYPPQALADAEVQLAELSMEKTTLSSQVQRLMNELQHKTATGQARKAADHSFVGSSAHKMLVSTEMAEATQLRCRIGLQSCSHSWTLRTSGTPSWCGRVTLRCSSK